MFDVNQKRYIASEVQRILRETGHPELPAGEIDFHLHVDGAESWSWADIRNNAAVANPTVNPWNERLAAPEPVGPTDEELWALGNEDFRANCYPTDAIRYARAVLARWRLND